MISLNFNPNDDPHVSRMIVEVPDEVAEQLHGEGVRGILHPRHNGIRGHFRFEPSPEAEMVWFVLDTEGIRGGAADCQVREFRARVSYPESLNHWIFGLVGLRVGRDIGNGGPGFWTARIARNAAGFPEQMDFVDYYLDGETVVRQPRD